jgi:hypothetical protein
VSRVPHYLQIPEEYAGALGGVRWSPAHDVLLLPEGPEGGETTFAFNAEVLSFLEGFAAQRPLIHFAHVLHLLRLLREGGWPRRVFDPLRASYRAAGSLPRNAGAFCAWLCRGVRPAPDPPSVDELAEWWAVRWVAPGFLLSPLPADEPPLGPGEFEALVADSLEECAYDDLVHWLRYGQAPADDMGEQLARALEGVPPRSLEGVFAELGRRERLAPALPLVDQLAGALSLPPRKLAPPELPLGGYCDVTTRGQPEQILVSQFALDELEFVRRHAEHELLYYRREEPPARVREELLVLLDQGVRTWGPVRLVLAAAVFALGRVARRRGAPFRVAATSGGGVPVDPLGVGPEMLGELLEASDLTAHPAEALERVLREKSEAPRDVVLLTHPRNLGEEEVSAAARCLRPNVRLFALAVDGRGSAGLSELRHGGAVPLSRFRVEVDRPGSEPARRPVAYGPWPGDVERVGFPFRFGIGHPGPLKFDFDLAGEWLLAATPEGMLHLTRTDGSSGEVLPRGMVRGQLLTRVQAVLGVAGGFVVAGEISGHLVGVHYDLRARTVRAHEFPAEGAADGLLPVWWYEHARHLLGVYYGGKARGVRLSTGGREEPHCGGTSPPPEGFVPRPGRWHALPPREGGAEPWPWLEFDAEKGSIRLYRVGAGWREFTPLADGRPALRGHALLRAVCHGHILAGVFRGPEAPAVLRVFRGPEGVPVGVYTLGDPRHEAALTRDGRLLAFQRVPAEVEVHDGRPGGRALCVMPAGRFHHDVEVFLGDCWLTLGVGGHLRHLVRWKEGRLDHTAPHGTQALRRWRPTGAAVEPGRLPEVVRYDTRRFVGAAWGDLVAVVDRFGEVFLLRPSGELVAAFFALRGQLAAWLPDGTRYGPESLAGGLASPAAAERIGQALLAASRPREGVAP